MSAYDKVPGDRSTESAYVKVPGVQGRSTEISHLKWIETLSWHWGISQFGAPTPEYREFSFTMEYDTASQQLTLLAHSGAPMSDARVDFTRGKGREKRTVMRFVLGDVRILRVAGSSQIEVAMGYKKIQ